MKGIRTAFALAVTILAITVLATAAPAAAAAPDGYQPQLQAGDDQPDAFMRAFRNTPDGSDVVVRYLRNHATVVGAGVPAAHPDSRAVRPSPGAGRSEAIDGNGIDWNTGGVGVALGLLLAALAVGTASATRGRLALR